MNTAKGKNIGIRFFIITAIAIVLAILCSITSKKSYEKAYNQEYAPYLEAKYNLESVEENPQYYSITKYEVAKEKAKQTEKSFKKYDKAHEVFLISSWILIGTAVISLILGIIMTLKYRKK